MPRPTKCRRVCCMPNTLEFAPASGSEPKGAVTLTVDEYETIRLIDKEGLSQEECGQRMEVARTTVQQIYTSARRKVAQALVDGLHLKIEGGQYRLCDGQNHCGCPGCRVRQNTIAENKGGNSMKIAIPLDENKQDVCVVFARAPFFLIHDQQTGAQQIVENPAAQAQGGAGLKAAQFVADQEADVLITVRCGENAAEVLKAAQVAIYKSQGKSAAENLTALQEGKLEILTHFHAGFHGHQ